MDDQATEGQMQANSQFCTKKPMKLISRKSSGFQIISSANCGLDFLLAVFCKGLININKLEFTEQSRLLSKSNDNDFCFTIFDEK